MLPGWLDLSKLYRQIVVWYLYQLTHSVHARCTLSSHLLSDLVRPSVPTLTCLRSLVCISLLSGSFRYRNISLAQPRGQGYPVTLILPVYLLRFIPLPQTIRCGWIRLHPAPCTLQPATYRDILALAALQKLVADSLIVLQLTISSTNLNFSLSTPALLFSLTPVSSIVHDCFFLISGPPRNCTTSTL